MKIRSGPVRLFYLLVFPVLIFSLPVTAPAAPARWHLKTSPHFEIYHEAAWAPQSISLELERLYGKLRLGVSMFAPWMTREKTKIYIYATRDSYLSGEFKPPPWSKGLAYFSKRTVVVFDPGDMEKLRAVTAHELAHLYFESYYGEYLKYPPRWLNEGLAVMMEDLSYDEEGPWSRALAYAITENFQPLDDFFRTEPERLRSAERISYWYLQAFSAVSYLYRPSKRLLFGNFCAALRKGGEMNSALWKFYRLNGPVSMETAWRGWVEAYGEKERQGFPPDRRSDEFIFKPVQLTRFKFVNFGSTEPR